MSEQEKPDVPPEFFPKPEDYSFDLEEKLTGVLAVRSQMGVDAVTASHLGTEREGHGVLISESGLVLTIGYLITEAETIWLIDASGGATPAHTVGYDQETGFGLVQALGRLNVPHLEIGDSNALMVGDPIVIGASGGIEKSVAASVVSKREFAGYWEYVLDEGIFTAPAHPFWGGSGAIDRDGNLVGITSLFVQQALPEDTPFHGNLIVPIDLFKPIMDDLLQFGRVQKPPRPWLGIIMSEIQNALVVANINDRGPAKTAGLQIGDIILGVNGDQVDDLPSLFRSIWRVGEAGVEVPLVIVRDGEVMEIGIPSVDRRSVLKSPQLH
ncbi:MAG: signal protein PDZ [Rhodospirillaceae bacterium]|nr:signal protein PDZ [Rhodospirillaceae bacterium]